MATTFLAEDPIQGTFLLPGTNTPGNGVQLFCYAAGSRTKTTVYKDNAAATPWTNPIVLDSGGNLPSGAQVWQSQGQSMKYVYAPSNDTDPPASPYRTLDNMPGVNDVTAQTGVEWLSGPTPTFVSGTQFTLVGDQTSTFTKGRRVKTTNTGGTVYSTIVGSTFGALTTVNIVNDASSLDAGLSAVSYGLFDPANVSISPSEIYRKGANVASAANATTDIWGVVGDYIHITGTNNIRNFSSAPYAGAERTVIFDGALTVFSSAALTIPGNSNISTAANDRAVVRADTTANAIITQYTRSSTQPLGINPTRTALTTSSQALTSTGTYITPVGAVRLFMRLIAGGGGGGASVTNNGTAGISSTIATLSASGGGAGNAAANGFTNGGPASGGSVNITGGAGQGGANAASVMGGQGGASVFGGNGAGGTNAQGGSNAAANSGGGGGGGGGTGTTSGGGGGAGGYVEAIIPSPASSYAYQIGAGGTGGPAGTQAGGNGAAGIIIIDEYYA
jgi:hypothetical protein